MKTLKNRTGYTLIELVVVTLTIGVLCAVAIVAFGNTAERSKVETTIREARKFNDAAIAFHAFHGRWPQNANYATLPSDFAGVFAPRDFTRQPPCGGAWDWNGTGTGLPKIGISIRFPNNKVPQDLCLQIDRAIDDGNLRTGAVDLVNLGKNSYLQFQLDNK